MSWRTIRTPHFRIHYPEELHTKAIRTASVAEEAYSRLVPVLGWKPAGVIELVVSDFYDSPNGYASIFPYNLIHIYVVSPEPDTTLGFHDDWLRLLIVHELTHILHLDNVDGLPKLINRVFGKTVAPNALTPRWLVEGLAVYQESAQTGGGRVRSSITDMILRAAVVEDQLTPLSGLSGVPDGWPRGNALYLYGARFTAYLVERFGDQAVASYLRRYGGTIIPFGLNRTAIQAFGTDLLSLWEEWHQDLRQSYGELVQQRTAQGLTPTKALTSLGYRHSSPRFSPDGRHLVWVEQSSSDESKLVLAEAGGTGHQRTVATLWRGGGSPAFDPDGKSLVYGATQAYRRFYRYSDLHRVCLESGRITRLTRGLRARDPHVAPDGRLAFVVNHPGGSSLWVSDSQADQREQVPLHLYGVDQVDGPRWSPDGKRLAATVRFSDGRQDVVVFRLVGGPLGRGLAGQRGGIEGLEGSTLSVGHFTRITHDGALDLAPSWSPDGRVLFYASDRDGVFEIYGYDFRDGMNRRYTHGIGGLFSPEMSPNGKTMAAIGYSSRGYDVHLLDMDALAPQPAPPVHVASGVSGGVDAHSDSRTLVAGPSVPNRQVYAAPADARGGNLDLPSTRYSPVGSFYPRAWMPLLGQNGYGEAVGLVLDGRDALGHHVWLAGADVGLVEPVWQGAFRYTYGGWLADVSLFGSRSVQYRGNILRIAGARHPYHEESRVLGGDLAFPLLVGLHQRHQVTLRASGEWVDAHDQEMPAHDPLAPRPHLPETGLISSLSFGYSYSSVRAYSGSISPERGRSFGISTRLRHPRWGSIITTSEIHYRFRQYWAIPWATHHAVMASVYGGVGWGDQVRRGFFVLGGPPEQDLLRSLIEQRYYGGGFLRGFPVAFLSGEQSHALSLEYRLPLVSVDRGFATLPFQMGALNGAAFVDSGTAFSGPFQPGGVHTGVGLELRASFTMGYVMPAMLRLGLAKGIGPEGIWDAYLFFGGMP